MPPAPIPALHADPDSCSQPPQPQAVKAVNNPTLTQDIAPPPPPPPPPPQPVENRVRSSEAATPLRGSSSSLSDAQEKRNAVINSCDSEHSPSPPSPSPSAGDAILIRAAINSKNSSGTHIVNPNPNPNRISTDSDAFEDSLTVLPNEHEHEHAQPERERVPQRVSEPKQERESEREPVEVEVGALAGAGAGTHEKNGGQLNNSRSYSISSPALCGADANANGALSASSSNDNGTIPINDTDVAGASQPNSIQKYIPKFDNVPAGSAPGRKSIKSPLPFPFNLPNRYASGHQTQANPTHAAAVAQRGFQRSTSVAGGRQPLQEAPPPDYNTLPPVRLIKEFVSNEHIGLMQITLLFMQIPERLAEQPHFFVTSFNVDETQMGYRMGENIWLDGMQIPANARRDTLVKIAIFILPNSKGDPGSPYIFFVLTDERYATPHSICTQFDMFLRLRDVLYGSFWEEFLVKQNGEKCWLFFKHIFDTYFNACNFQISRYSNNRNQSNDQSNGVQSESESESVSNSNNCEFNYYPQSSQHLSHHIDVDFDQNIFLGAMESLSISDDILKECEIIILRTERPLRCLGYMQAVDEQPGSQSALVCSRLLNQAKIQLGAAKFQVDDQHSSANSAFEKDIKSGYSPAFSFILLGNRLLQQYSHTKEEKLTLSEIFILSILANAFSRNPYVSQAQAHAQASTAAPGVGAGAGAGAGRRQSSQSQAAAAAAAARTSFNEKVPPTENSSDTSTRAKNRSSSSLAGAGRERERQDSSASASASMPNLQKFIADHPPNGDSTDDDDDDDDSGNEPNSGSESGGKDTDGSQFDNKIKTACWEKSNLLNGHIIEIILKFF